MTHTTRRGFFTVLVATLTAFCARVGLVQPGPYNVTITTGPSYISGTEIMRRRAYADQELIADYERFAAAERTIRVVDPNGHARYVEINRQ